MAVLTTGNTFSNGDQVTASSLNNAVDNAEFAAGAVDGISTQLSGTNPQQIIVKDLGISRGKIAIDAVGTDQLANDVVINTSGSITGAAGSFTTLAASGDVTFDTDTLKVDSTNNRVGIGTASPTQPLDVNGQARVVGNLFVGTDDTNPNGMIEVYGGGSGQSEGGEIRLRTAAGYDTTYNHYFIDAYEDDLRIGRSVGADITLTSDGNVGIGQTTLADTLTIGKSSYAVDETERMRVVIGSTTSGSHVSAGFGIKTNSLGQSRLSIETATDTSGGLLEVITANSSGNVGIGTTPSHKLDVNSGATNQVALFESTDATAYIELADDTGSAQLLTPSSGDFRIYTGGSGAGNLGTSKLVVEAGGNVGIGIESPNAKLQIKTSASEVEGISVLNAGNTSEIFKVIEDGSNGGYVDIRNSSNTSAIRLNSSSDSYFNGGNVGIGTTLPGAILQTSTADNMVASFKSTDPTAYVQIIDSVDATYIGSQSGIGFIGGSASVSSNNINIDLSNGKVGIGTASPSAPLTVTSTTGGVILPRMTTTQKNAISSPSNGEMVYDTTDNKFYGYASGAWVALH